MIVESYEDIIILSGSLHSNQWETLHTAISLNLRRHPEGVVVDCSGLTDINERGADTFRSVMNYLEAHDARVIVAAVPPKIMEVLRNVPDVRSQLPIVATVEEARKSLFLVSDPEAESQQKRKRGPDKQNQLLVCLAGTDCDNYVLDTASQIAEGLDAQVRAVFPIIVPREMPIQSPLPEIESTAKSSLEYADTSLEEHEIEHSLQVERGRDVASAIADVLLEHPATHVVIGLPADDALDPAGKLVKSVLAKVKCSVIFVRGPQDN